MPVSGAATGVRPSWKGFARPHRWLPFWILQAAELVVAFVFVDISIHVDNGGLLVAAAVSFAVLAITVRGPLGIVRICGRRLHTALVVAIAVLVAIAPIVPGFRPDVQGIIVVEFGAIGLIRLATFTRTDPNPTRSGGSRGVAGSVIDANASVAVPDPAGAGRRSVGTSRGAGPSRRPAPDGAARWAGRTTAELAASGRRAAAKRRPGAEARVKRTIRSAGHLTGWAASKAKTRDPDA